VQACLLRFFARSVRSATIRLGLEGAIEASLKEVSIIKKSLEAAGYGARANTPELYSMLIASFGALNLSDHGVVAPTGDLRKIEVCATYIPGRKADILRRAHSFIIYTDATGKSFFISAHDDGTGILRTENGPWSPTIFGDPAMERKVVASGAEAENAFPTMLRAAERIDSEGLDYKATTLNCNSATHYLLSSAGYGDTPAPSFMTATFGWSKPLQAQLNKPQRKRGMAATSRPAPSTILTTTAANVAAPSTTASTSAISTSTPTSATTRAPATMPAPATASSSSTTTIASTAPPPSVSGPAPRSPAVQAENVLTLVLPLRLNGVDLQPGTDVVVLKTYEKKNELLIQVHPDGRTGTVNADALDAATSMFDS